MASDQLLHETGLLPGQATHAIVEEGPYRLSRNPLYVGLLALYLGLALAPVHELFMGIRRAVARMLGPISQCAICGRQRLDLASSRC